MKLRDPAPAACAALVAPSRERELKPPVLEFPDKFALSLPSVAPSRERELKLIFKILVRDILLRRSLTGA